MMAVVGYISNPPLFWQYHINYSRENSDAGTTMTMTTTTITTTSIVSKDGIAFAS